MGRISAFAASVLLISLVLCKQAQSQPDKVLTPEMVVSLRHVSDVALDPAGELTAYILRVPGKADDPGSDDSELWLVSTKEGQARQYTFAPPNVSSPRWSPDGKSIAFLSRRRDYDEDQEIYLIPKNGGEAKQLSHSESSVLHFAWSPDGQWIAYIVRDPKTKEQIQAEKDGRDWEVADENYRHRRLWALNVNTGQAHKVVETDLSVWNFAWSPDSKTLVCQAAETPGTDDFYMFKKIYTVPLQGGNPRVLCQTVGKLGDMAWSPDGHSIAFLGAQDIHDPEAGSIFLVPSAGGAARNLTPNYDGSVTWLEWRDADTIAFAAIEGTKTALNLLSARNAEIKSVVSEGPVFSSASFSANGKFFACAANTAAHPNEVLFGTTDGRKLTWLTDSNPILREIRLAPQQTITWKSAGGVDVEGVLWKPVTYEPGRAYPLIVQPHGGPESASLDGWQTSYSRWSQLLAARGYFFLMPNYRGSIGRGEAFSRMDQDDHGGKEFQDILAGIEYLTKQGFIDPDRVGIGGGSYGGYLSAWAATRYSQHFRAAIVFAGISNWISKSGTSDIPNENALVHWTKWWFEQPELVWERSPLAHIKNAKTPTLIAQGAEDRRVPIEQAWQLYRALKQMNVPTQLVIYPREPHGLRENTHKLDYLERVVDWFDRYVRAEAAGSN